ncbi:MAG: LysM peptidoglycan-binding domain-containing protein [Verrucomicrobiota bacterium]|jgi:LysM repeat protein|nr:LysM peptidoglycan-binding domain-containing protein [Verrucomicrobiota bacterium]MEE3062196.1 LysM peptidoglycan-binding domain-containing protein [Verrucomicrobiota bacterium]
MRKFLFMILALAFGEAMQAEVVHQVRPNETLGGIARKYGVSVSALQAHNGIANPNLLFVGKKLKIPSSGASEVTYEVKKGDSLGGIASRFGVKVSTLTLVNKITRPDLIRVGQKLIIPIKAGSAKPASQILSSTVRRSLDAIRPKSGKWTRIVIHHSATPTDDAMNMHRVHKARGMKNGLAYHFVISNGSRKATDGEIFMGGRWKDQLDGGHMKSQSYNRTSIGICLIGNFELRAPTNQQMKSLEGLCKYLMKRCGIPADKVTTHKILHRNHTKCPGKYFSLPSLIQRISS